MYEYKMYGSFSDVTAEEFLYVQNDLSKFRLSWDNRWSNTSGNNFLIFIAQNDWPKWTRRVIVWFTIGKSTGLDSFPTGITVVTGVYRCWRILERSGRPFTKSYFPNSGWSRNRNSGLHININRSPRLQGVQGSSQGQLKLFMSQHWFSIKSPCFQVGNYRSALTVRAHTSPELPGTEFCLTGFEDPGVQLPEAIITWVCYFVLEHCHALSRSQSYPYLPS